MRKVKKGRIDKLSSAGYLASSAQCFMSFLLVSKVEINLVTDGGANSRGVNLRAHRR